MSAASLKSSIGKYSFCTQGFLNTTPARQFQTACFNASEALLMLAAVLFFAGVARSIVIVDVFQALLFTVLRFNLIYSPITRDHFNVYHLLIGQLMALFLFLVAMVACLGAASRAELKSAPAATLSCFLGLRLVAFFLANQVSYTWLHYEHCSLWDVPGEALLAGFALFLLYSSRERSSAIAAEAIETAPSPYSEHHSAQPHAFIPGARQLDAWPLSLTCLISVVRRRHFDVPGLLHGAHGAAAGSFGAGEGASREP